MTIRNPAARRPTSSGYYRYARPMEETLEADDDAHVALLCALGGFPRAFTHEGATYHILKE
jgi:hypothetical protein